MSAPVSIDPTLLEIIVCPDCRSSLRLEEADPAAPELVCQGCGLAYPVRDGIPVPESVRRMTAG